MAAVFGFVAALFGLAGLFSLANRKPVITLDAAGLWLHPCLATPVPWSQVVASRLEWQSKVGNVLMVDVALREGQAFEVNRLRCMAKAIAGQSQVVRIGIPVEGLTLSPGQILGAIKSHDTSLETV
jgi:hypothetical protein